MNPIRFVVPMESRSERVQVSVCTQKVLPEVVAINDLLLPPRALNVISVSIGSDFLPCIFCESSYVTDAKLAGKEDLDPWRWTGI